jgi:competence protein ComEA
MKGRGADASDDDFKTIVDYLAKYQGPEVNMNKATAQDLQSNLDLTAAEAAAIVKYRTDNGTFKTFADVQKVSGVDAKKLEPLKGRLTFN